ncbi:methyl-accepting chemotaxis protein, partial [Pseudomonas savastanoi pv. glycinea str. race 4]
MNTVPPLARLASSGLDADAAADAHFVAHRALSAQLLGNTLVVGVHRLLNGLDFGRSFAEHPIRADVLMGLPDRRAAAARYADDIWRPRRGFNMILRKLNLAPRSALSFGFFCLMILGLGLVALNQASNLNTAEKFVEENVVPSISLIAKMDREFLSIRNNNSRLRNPIEPAERRAQALVEVNKSKANFQDLFQKLQPLIVTPKGKELFGELLRVYNIYEGVQDQYLLLTSAGKFEDAVKLSSEVMKQGADGVNTVIQNLIELNNQKAERAGDDATRIYDQTKLIVGCFIVFSILAAIVLAFLYTRSITAPVSRSLAIAERIAKNDLSEVIDVQGTDEVAQLMHALKAMQGSLRTTLVSISDSSNQLPST